MSILTRGRNLRPLTIAGRRDRRGGPERRHRRRAGALRLRHAAGRHAQLHDLVRRRQGAEGKGGHEHPGAADRRRHRHHPDGQPRRGRPRHLQHHGSRRRLSRRAEEPAHHRRGARLSHAVLRAQGLQDAHHRRPQGQARGGRLFGHAQPRQGDAGPARHRRASPKRTSSRCRCRTWCAAPTPSSPATPTCSTSPSARPRCARSTPPSAASACSPSTRRAWRRRARSCPTAISPRCRRGRSSSAWRSR